MMIYDWSRENVENFPGYMIPQLWQEYELLPRNGIGKINRRKLANDEYSNR